MGIKGLIKILIPESVRLVKDLKQEFNGKVAAVDAYSWLYKGSYFLGDKIFFQEPGADAYISFILDNVNYLLSLGITPILVFDGLKLPAKENINNKRKE